MIMEISGESVRVRPREFFGFLLREGLNPLVCSEVNLDVVEFVLATVV